MAIVLIAVGSAPVLAAEPIDFIGDWQTIDDDTGQPKSMVELSIHNNRLYGKIIALERAVDEDADPLCKKCRGKEKNQKIIGMVILDGLRWDIKTEAWSRGTILDPAKGKRYDCKIWLQQGVLKVRGYLGIFFRTQTWQRP